MKIIEQIKNGIYFSGKYESQMKYDKPPHVVVFSNTMPDQSKLSADRWNIVFLDPAVDQQLAEPIIDIINISTYTNDDTVGAFISGDFTTSTPIKVERIEIPDTPPPEGVFESMLERTLNT